MLRPLTYTCLQEALGPLLAVLLGAILMAQPSWATPEQDALFDALKNAPNEQASEAIENEIWKSWLESAPTPELQVMVETAMQRRNVYDFQGARIFSMR